jgi:hypothetical protein
VSPTKPEEEINRDGQDEQDKSRTQKAELRFQISNLKSFYPVYPVHPC